MSQKKKETAGVLSNRPKTSQPRKTTVVHDFVRDVKKYRKTSVSDITNNLHRALVKVSQSTIWRRLREQQYRSYINHLLVVRIGRQDYNLKRSTEMSQITSGTWFYGLMRPKWTSTKVMERPKCGERRDLLMIQNMQAHLWSTWNKYHGLGLHCYLWSGLTNLYWWCNSWW